MFRARRNMILRSRRRRRRRRRRRSRSLHRWHRPGGSIFVLGVSIRECDAAVIVWVVVWVVMIGVVAATAGVGLRAALRVAASGQQGFQTFLHALVPGRSWSASVEYMDVLVPVTVDGVGYVPLLRRLSICPLPPGRRESSTSLLAPPHRLWLRLRP